jgi:hypothetical protein
MLDILKRKKQILTPLQKVLITFHEWKIETLKLNTSDFMFDHLDRVYIKDGQWLFNDFFDIKFDRDVAKNSQKYIKDASEREITVFNSFINLIDSFKNIR